LGARGVLGVVRQGESILASAIFIEVGGLVQYHLSGSDPASLKLQPTKLLLDHVRTWAKERGCTRLHLGGGTGGAADSLFKFKAGFGSGRHRFRTWRAILDADAY